MGASLPANAQHFTWTHFLAILPSPFLSLLACLSAPIKHRHILNPPQLLQKYPHPIVSQSTSCENPCVICQDGRHNPNFFADQQWQYHPLRASSCTKYRDAECFQCVLPSCASFRFQSTSSTIYSRSRSRKGCGSCSLLRCRLKTPKKKLKNLL
jgi:hypothetical protein